MQMTAEWKDPPHLTMKLREMAESTKDLPTDERRSQDGRHGKNPGKPAAAGRRDRDVDRDWWSVGGRRIPSRSGLAARRTGEEGER